MGIYDSQINKASAAVNRRPATSSELFFYDLRFGDSSYSYEQMVQEMLNATGSRSSKNTTFPVSRLFQAIFNRKPDTTGLDYWTQSYVYNLGVTGENEQQSLYSIASSFAQSLEWANAYPTSLTNTQFVQRLYRNTLRREGDSAGVANWVSQLDNGVMTRAQVAAEFSRSQEFKNLTDATIRAMLVAAGNDDPNAYNGSLV